MGEKQAPDWERIEVDYRAGIKSLREIAVEFGTSHVAIGKRAKKGGWVRDLQAKIRAKADELVTKAAVTKEVTAAALVTERLTVEVNAQALANVRLEHRTDIRRGRSLVNKLLTEMEGVTDRLDLIEDLQQALFQAESGGEDGDEVDRQAARGRAQRLREALERVIGLQGRVSSVKGLAESMRILITLEREAWGLDTDTTPDGDGAGKILSDVERAARLASVLDRARRAKAEAEKT
jgi:hypothetical protein